MAGHAEIIGNQCPPGVSPPLFDRLQPCQVVIATATECTGTARGKRGLYSKRCFGCRSISYLPSTVLQRCLIMYCAAVGRAVPRKTPPIAGAVRRALSRGISHRRYVRQGAQVKSSPVVCLVCRERARVINNSVQYTEKGALTSQPSGKPTGVGPVENCDAFCRAYLRE